MQFPKELFLRTKKRLNPLPAGSSLLHDSAEARPAADLSPEMGEVVGAGQEAAGSLGNAAAEEKEAQCIPPSCR